MTLHVCILGIDGSGKSTITAALPTALAAETGVLAGSAGEEFRVCGPDQDHLAPKFHPEGLPFTARLAGWFKRASRRFVDSRRLYPGIKLAYMILQDMAAAKLGRRHGASVVFSDGNTLLSSAGRAANYLRPTNSGTYIGSSLGSSYPDAADLEAALRYILSGKTIPPESRRRLPSLWAARLLYRACELLGVRAAWLPDVIVFLDIAPEAAARRIAARGRRVDRHENPADLAQASRMYRECVEAFSHHCSPDAVHHLAADGLSPGQTVTAIVEALSPRVRAAQRCSQAQDRPLGTSRLTSREVKKTALGGRYIFRYFLGKAHKGSWRGPTFLFSSLGRAFLKEGYSAGVMRAIYESRERHAGPLDRVFLEYPLHRAVHDRLPILTRNLERELDERLKAGREVRIFTAPSGFAYDLFEPLEKIAARNPEFMSQVHLVAADLDPKQDLAGELSTRAAKLGIDFEFHRGDMTNDDVRRGFAEVAPYDVALFVGISAWLPKPGTLDHLRWLRENLRDDGLLVTDSFTPEAYALSGQYAGYKANYYEPEVCRTLLDSCGFDGFGAEIESGRDGINHVLLARPRRNGGA